MSAPTLTHLTAGAERLAIVIAARRLQRERSLTIRELGHELDVKWPTLFKWLKRVEHIQDDAELRAEHLADGYHRNGRKPALELLPEETAAIRANKLLNNRNADSGSTPEAIRQTIKEGKLRPEIAAFFNGREGEGRALTTPALANALHIPPTTTRAFRNGRNAWLDFVESPGSIHMTRDAVTGETRPVEPGEWVTIDDGTKNFICTVPMQRPGDKCFDNFGVVVGRWQFLLLVDHRSYFILGFCHTARPKGSYRAEDMQAAFHISFKEHGLPKKVVLEKGISKADLLHQTFDRLGVAYEHVNSPHQKVVEFVFNNLWSKLSFLPGQVGRVRGEEEQVDAIVESCKRGATDPRGYFLPLPVVLRALSEAIAEWNAHRVKSDQYGSWIPRDWFAKTAPTHLRKLHPADAWMFSPVITDPLLVRGQTVQTSFQVMPGYSWRFDYSAPWFHEYFGARVRFHFNPFEPECLAKVVLAEPFHGNPADTVLGDAEQINWHTRHNRRLLGIDETEDIGLVRTRMNAQALHRSAVAIRPDGKPGVQAHEARDGAGRREHAEIGGGRGEAVALPAPGRTAAAPAPTSRRQRLERQNEADEALANLTD